MLSSSQPHQLEPPQILLKPQICKNFWRNAKKMNFLAKSASAIRFPMAENLTSPSASKSYRRNFEIWKFGEINPNFFNIDINKSTLKVRGLEDKLGLELSSNLSPNLS